VDLRHLHGEGQGKVRVADGSEDGCFAEESLAQSSLALHIARADVAADILVNAFVDLFIY